MRRLFVLGIMCLMFVGAFASEEELYVLHQVRFWHGSEDDSMDTRTFAILDDAWRVWWATERGKHGPANFQIWVKEEDGEFESLAANVIGESNHWATIRQKGRFYLQISTMQPYMITVYSHRKED